jgi:hypothetical protein
VGLALHVDVTLAKAVAHKVRMALGEPLVAN